MKWCRQLLIAKWRDRIVQGVSTLVTCQVSNILNKTYGQDHPSRSQTIILLFTYHVLTIQQNRLSCFIHYTFFSFHWSTHNRQRCSLTHVIIIIPFYSKCRNQERSDEIIHISARIWVWTFNIDKTLKKCLSESDELDWTDFVFARKDIQFWKNEKWETKIKIKKAKVARVDHK